MKPNFVLLELEIKLNIRKIYNNQPLYGII